MAKRKVEYDKLAKGIAVNDADGDDLATHSGKRIEVCSSIASSKIDMLMTLGNLTVFKTTS